jgi:hypothetical protein
MCDAMDGLTDKQVAAFVRDGVVRIDGAFPRLAADVCRAVLWRDTGANPSDSSTWTKAVVRLGNYYDPTFVGTANTPVLHAAFDRLVGRGRWVPPASVGTFPVRFPSPEDPGDAGWHIDASFPPPGGDAQDYMSWRVNVNSRGRALLLLLLFSDVGPDDAPTRIRLGSHRDVARRLAGVGESGLNVLDLQDVYTATEGLPEVFATGDAGTAYLCHPFLVHAAQPHRGTRPRFMAQPPLFPAQPLSLAREAGDHSPVERAIRLALDMERA